jgi:hypothetical protein
VFPLADLQHVRKRIAELASDSQHDPWVIDAADPSDSPAIYVSIATTTDELAGLYRDWEPSDVEALRAALGHLPEWCVSCDVSGRIPGDAEIRSLVLDLLADGGVAVDDYSDHCWTRAEIVEDRAVDGLRFFDYRADYERTRDDRH